MKTFIASICCAFGLSAFGQFDFTDQGMMFACGAKPTITVQPVSVTCITNTTTNFSVTATGPNLVYQWRTNSVNVADNSHWFGSTTATLWVSNVTSVDSNLLVSCVVASPYGSVASSAATLTVTNGAGGGGDASLVQWLKMDDGSGITISDSSGNSIDGTLDNGGTWITGHLGGGLSFASQDALLGVSGLIGLSGATSELTISAWVKTSASNASIVSMYDGGNPIIVFVVGNNGVENAGTGKLAILLRDNAGGGLKSLVAGTAVNTDTWTHVAITRNSSKLITIYVNGISDGSGSDTMGTGVTISNKRLCGSAGIGGISSMFGSIDDFRFYSRALSQLEVLALASQ